MDEKILDKMLDIAEQFFGSLNDSQQMPITKESFRKLQKIHPKTLIYRKVNGEPISWVVLLPTSKDLAQKFLQGEINEREMLNMTKPQKEYEALYLCVAFTIPKFRRKGYIIEMSKEAIAAIPHTSDAILFAWPFSAEGKLLINKLEHELGVEILLGRHFQQKSKL